MEDKAGLRSKGSSSISRFVRSLKRQRGVLYNYIYTDDTSIYSSLNSNSDQFDVLQFIGDLKKLTTICWELAQWILLMVTPKSNILSINRLRESLLPSISRTDANLHESASFLLLCLTFSADRKWKYYIKSIASWTAGKIDSLCCSTQFFLARIYVTYLQA